ncbi:hypothetical protein AA671_18780 [Delftia tsuruhatensis]|jgi:integrating conjugative element protein (TIGR03749 family)|uniref:TIGR03749 family integrating conjugative element protein n=1 Tax=Delftia tsuruhatensis TaxID=180282 RepID=UPI000641E679|nr:TIGR03749 family integrating conjugative element protein [Delftia tsuruhatensis]KLO58207.1 hypothetical protein AA671_18780 [Delftia tsuruhatensis]
MKHSIRCLLGLWLLAAGAAAQAVDILRWERLPLAVPLVVGQERVVFIDRNVRVGVPAAISEQLRVQSAGGAVYLLAREPIAPSRLQLQDADTGALILLDIAAEPARPDAPPLEPVRIVEGEAPAPRYGRTPPADAAAAPQAPRNTPVAVALTRYAAQSLYAPLRTVEAVEGIARVNLRRDLDLSTLLPGVAVQATALAAWRLHDHWVSAVRLSHLHDGWVSLDPRALQGDFLAASFQHDRLGPRGTPEDTTVVYVVTRGRGLASALLPAMARFDPRAVMDPSVTEAGDAQ